MKPNLVSRRQFIQSAAAVSVAFVTPKIAWGQTSADVIVIGAGMSGLKAALLLEAQGLDVRILEGRNRIGGRVYSLGDVPGNPEAGANAIVAKNALATARQYGAELIDRSQRPGINRERLLVLGGKIISPSEWPDSPRNPFPKDQRETMPWGYVSPLVSKNNPLKNLEDWVDPAYASHDISLHTFLEKQGATDSIIQLAVDTNCIYDRSAHDVSTLMPFQGDIRRTFRQESWTDQLRGQGRQPASAGGHVQGPQAPGDHAKNRLCYSIRSRWRGCLLF